MLLPYKPEVKWPKLAGQYVGNYHTISLIIYLIKYFKTLNYKKIWLVQNN